MKITESSITLEFPDNQHFRFENCTGYSNLQHLKEMDVCWYETKTDTLFLIELKNWDSFTLVEENDVNNSSEMIQEIKDGISNHRINDLCKKSLDSVSMFMSILLNKPYSKNIQNCAPFTITQNTKIKLISIINWTKPDATYIANINAAYKSKFKCYANLFNIISYNVITKDQAIENFDWVS